MLGLPATVLSLGLVSLLTDLSSEMIYPLLPAFLAGVLGAGPALLGIIEGVAETTASFVKVVSGYGSDRLHRRKAFVLAGYGLSGACRPLIGLASSWLGVLGFRFGDRVGKGLRTSPRDALIADAVAPAKRGAAYGFHRSMDHAGHSATHVAK
jgi:MFS family permease